MYDAACALRDAMLTLRVAVDGGKDSLSMAAAAGGEIVMCPGNLVVSAYATVPDITQVGRAGTCVGAVVRVRMCVGASWVMQCVRGAGILSRPAIGYEMRLAPRIFFVLPVPRQVVTPDLKLPGSSAILHVDLAAGRRRLGGSALAQAYSQASPGCRRPAAL